MLNPSVGEIVLMSLPTYNIRLTEESQGTETGASGGQGLPIRGTSHGQHVHVERTLR